MKKYYQIFVDNQYAHAHNINIDRPMFECFAINKHEAVGKMILSDWLYKSLPILNMNEHPLI